MSREYTITCNNCLETRVTVADDDEIKTEIGRDKMIKSATICQKCESQDFIIDKVIVL